MESMIRNTRIWILVLLAIAGLAIVPSSAFAETRASWCGSYWFRDLPVKLRIVNCSVMTPSAKYTSSVQTIGYVAAVGQSPYWMRVELRTSANVLVGTTSDAGQIEVADVTASHKAVCQNASGYSNAIQCGVV
ncbi:hypothetical protein H5398_01370 [Tessaracoccus sp. MC1679]|uniref:hypothetical protein n=1 Tax=Tessaracoccus sp. MC1679 TaxID=2760313 RepID=UPI0015FFAB67|nr:hypothetical protein [Tessaracoccus sp. MC1679]MBB1514630.1 hypothetical protein [Tessaracoccus sp. MC1679]